MKKQLSAVLFLVWASSASAFFNFGDKSLSEKNIDFWQPETKEEFVLPERIYGMWHYERNMAWSGLAHFKRIIPTFNNKGTLFASWNPNFSSNKVKPTIIIAHGGHGTLPGDLAVGVNFQSSLGANILILDSFWSRGKFENHDTTNRLGVDARVLDVVAAARWLKQQPEVDSRLIYVYGGSQGGWLGLRLMTDDPYINSITDNVIKGAFSLYPFCKESPRYGGRFRKNSGIDIEAEPWLAPNLGPYKRPVYVFTGGKDEPTNPADCESSVFKEATEWHHYPDSTHGWDLHSRGSMPAYNGECARAKNPYLRFQVCRNDKTTYDVLDKIKQVIRRDVSSLSP